MITKVLYIIPSIGRDTICKTIKSIQTYDPFSTIIISNGKKTGDSRNIGLSTVKNLNVDWVGFIDDDDFYDGDFTKELDKQYDIVIIRMNQEGKIIPRYEYRELKRGNVGINFFLKSNLFLKHPNIFDNKQAEDWRFLEYYLNLTDKIKITDKIYYNAPISNKGEK